MMNTKLRHATPRHSNVRTAIYHPRIEIRKVVKIYEAANWREKKRIVFEETTYFLVSHCNKVFFFSVVSLC